MTFDCLSAMNEIVDCEESKDILKLMLISMSPSYGLYM